MANFQTIKKIMLTTGVTDLFNASGTLPANSGTGYNYGSWSAMVNALNLSAGEWDLVNIFNSMGVNTSAPFAETPNGHKLIIQRTGTKNVRIYADAVDNAHQIVLYNGDFQGSNPFLALAVNLFQTEAYGVGLIMIYNFINHLGQNINTATFFFGSTVNTLLAPLLQNQPDFKDPYSTAPISDNDGGLGDFDYTSDQIPLPTAPTLSISESGFITLYKPTIGQLQSLAAYMWSGLFDMATFRKIFADPMDCIISLAMIPIDPTASGSQELKVGNIGTGITIDKLSTQFVEVNFNSLNIGRRANNFMDYSPYTKAQIYLPFIGTRSISIDDIAGRNITLKYVIDIFTGACNASLGVEVEVEENGQKVKRTTTLYQFTGNVLANVPVTANNFASFLQATVSAVSTAVGVATGAGALAGVASAINAAQSMKPDIEKSGNLSSTAGFLGVQKPYLILTYPNLCRPEGRDKVTGTPSFIGLSNSKKLSSFHGFTQLHRVNVQGITCTETEHQMILSQLTGEGVILP